MESTPQNSKESKLNEDDKKECSVRLKFAKLWKEKDSPAQRHFQLYTTYANPGLVSIFHNEDQRCFHNWGLEVGSGNKRGRIREAIDHQINTSVLEIAGDHDGSVFMQCPPDSRSTINVDIPLVTILMKDMNGYSSVEFTVLDTLGFSRKICAKNFISQTTIGELNCEIPMRLSPAWNYACVNLDETLRNAFGTKLSAVQRIKVNANARVRRIYFHDDVIAFKDLPQEFRIKLTLSPQEKQEVQIFEQFLYTEPGEKNVPWCLPKLIDRLPSQQDISMSSYNGLQTNLRRKVEINEVPDTEDDPDKYTNVNSGLMQISNSGLLKEMLVKSIPPQKILLPTLSLIYPDKKGDVEAAHLQNEKLHEYLKGKGQHETKFFAKNFEHCKDGAVSEGAAEKLRKLKYCINPEETRSTYQAGETDWEKFHSHQHKQHSDKYPHMLIQSRHDEQEGEVEGDYVPTRPYQHPNHYNHNCSKLTVGDLAHYLKHRETHGDYDMFSGIIGNTKFLVPPGGEAFDNLSSSSINSEEDTSSEMSIERAVSNVESSDHPTEQTAETPFMIHRISHKAPSDRSSAYHRLSTLSHMSIQDPSHSTNLNGSGEPERLESTESWLLTWTFQGLSWTQTREVNQRLLNEARDKNESPLKKKSIQDHSSTKRGTQKLPHSYRHAVPILPKLMKEELRGTKGFYDIIIDNTTLPIEYY